MKKILTIATFLIAGSINFSYAEVGINAGFTLSSKLFEVDGASEKFTAGTTNVNSGTATPKQEDAEALIAYASLFLEKELGDKFAIGVDYVPYALESETKENIRYSTIGKSASTNNVQVDFEDLLSLYAKVNLNENFYAKAGYSQVEAVTNESLGTGSSYGDVTLDGYTLGLGYNKDLSNDTFIRIEASYMEIDGATLNSTVNSAANGTRSVTADGITGYGASLSIGKSF